MNHRLQVHSGKVSLTSRRLMFLKMASERKLSLPKGCNWEFLRSQDVQKLISAYAGILRTLGSQSGLVGDIYARAEARFTKPSTLKHLIEEIDRIPWSSANVDVKAAAYAGLLEKVASEGKKGAGQLFTPTVLVESIVRCMRPDPRASKQFTICDPACGTAGFLVASYKWLLSVTSTIPIVVCGSFAVFIHICEPIIGSWGTKRFFCGTNSPCLHSSAFIRVPRQLPTTTTVASRGTTNRDLQRNSGRYEVECGTTVNRQPGLSKGKVGDGVGGRIMVDDDISPTAEYQVASYMWYYTDTLRQRACQVVECSGVDKVFALLEKDMVISDIGGLLRLL